MSTLIAVVVAFLANGDMNYAAVDAKDEADCKQKAAEIAKDRLDQSQQEEVKILGFSYECIEFENRFPVTVPSEREFAQPKHIPTDDEA
jgi:hypothetical protein